MKNKKQKIRIEDKTKTLQLDIEEFLAEMESGNIVEQGSPMLYYFHELSQEALKITTELNNKYHTPEEIVEIFSELTGRKVDKTFRMFPPFYTDCGKNIKLGKNVFINSGCKFQDQGGIIIGDGCLLGHNVIITTLNHGIAPSKRQSLIPKQVKIGRNVWIGASVTILPGVTIGDNAIIGAGSIVVKDIPDNTIAVGNPCKVIRKIESEVNND